MTRDEKKGKGGRSREMARVFANSHYILMGKLAVPEPDLFKWATWFETADRHVADEKIGGIRVSTIFLGLDHSFGQGLPLLFETMTFGGGQWGGIECQRCGTWDEAEKQHAAMCERIRRDIKDKVND